MGKWIVIVSFLLCGVGSAASTCPDFTGRYVSSSGDTEIVTQDGCHAVSISLQFAGQHDAIPATYLIDGTRHEIRNIFWQTWWTTQGASTKFWREPWSSAVGGEELGFRESWTLGTGSPQTIVDDVFDGETGGLILSKIWTASAR